MTEQEGYLNSILPDTAANMSKTNISKTHRSLHSMDFEPFHVEETGTPGMTVDVYGGRFFIGDTYTEFSLDGNLDVTTTASGTFTAPTVNPKIDLLYYDVIAGTLGITAGAEGASPAQPTMPDPRDQIPVALIYHRVGSTSIKNTDDSTNSYIMGRNIRPFLNIDSFQNNFKKGADIASAAALAPGSDGNAFDVTGTTGPITSINSLGAGTLISLRFDSTPTLTHHATNLDLGGSDITVAAGQILTLQEYASGDWRLVSSSVSLPAVNMTKFSARGSSTVNNVTGDGTVHVIVYGTERFDIGSNFDSSTGIFTAPITGKYDFSGMVQIQGIEVASGLINSLLVTSNFSYDIWLHKQTWAAGDKSSIGFSVLADMDAGDTAFVNIAVNSGTKAIDLLGAQNHFQGKLVI
jgi:hypothetical protein